MEKKTQLTLLLENRVGALTEVLNPLAKAKVNIEAITVCDGIHHGVLRLVTANPEAARKALKSAEVPFSERRVYSLKLADRPGALAETCSKLAGEGINLDFVYGSTCTCGEEERSGGCEGRLVVSCAEPAEGGEKKQEKKQAKDKKRKQREGGKKKGR